MKIPVFTHTRGILCEIINEAPQFHNQYSTSSRIFYNENSSLNNVM